MRVRVFSGLLLCLLASPAPANVWADAEWFRRLVRFEQQYQGFLLELFACDGAAISPDECRGHRFGNFNVRKWEKTRRAAKSLFGLREEKGIKQHGGKK